MAAATQGFLFKRFVFIPVTSSQQILPGGKLERVSSVLKLCLSRSTTQHPQQPIKKRALVFLRFDTSAVLPALVPSMPRGSRTRALKNDVGRAIIQGLNRKLAEKKLSVSALEKRLASSAPAHEQTVPQIRSEKSAARWYKHGRPTIRMKPLASTQPNETIKLNVIFLALSRCSSGPGATPRRGERGIETTS